MPDMNRQTDAMWSEEKAAQFRKKVEPWQPMARPISGPIGSHTRYGFQFGALLVQRATSLPDGRVCVSVTSDSGKKLHIYASPTGRSVRVFEPGVGEWRPVSDA